MPTGVIISCLAVLIGGMTGYFLRSFFSESIKASLNGAFGLAAMVIGISLITGVNSLSAVILSLLLGCCVGTALKIEERTSAGIGRITRKIPCFAHMDEIKTESLISVMILILTSTTGIFGAINEGITGDHTILITKAILDFFTAAIFAADIGTLVPLLSIPQFVLLFALYLSGGTLSSVLTDLMIADFKACGGIIILSVAFRIMNVNRFKAMNLLPALVIVLPVSYYWIRLFG